MYIWSYKSVFSIICLDWNTSNDMLDNDIKSNAQIEMFEISIYHFQTFQMIDIQ